MKEIHLPEFDPSACLQTSLSTTLESPNKKSTYDNEFTNLNDVDHQLLTKTVEDLKKKLKEKRKNLTFYSKPLLTLTHCSVIITQYISMVISRILLHPISYYLIFPTLISMQLLQTIQGPHSHFIGEFWIVLKLIVWWTSLGFLSSVGLGTGMHTGLLFLFPHFFLICTTSEVCNSLDFDARVNMWQNSMRTLNHFECITHNPPEIFEYEVTFYGLVMKTFPFAILWGLGSALGELPPYAASYAAAMARLEDEGFEEIKADLHSNRGGFMRQIKGLTMRLVRNYGSISVFFLSAWPNAFFDLCGIICGHFMMPFWKFFIPLAIGKGVVKLFFQCCFFVFLFSSKFDKMRAHLVTVLANFWPLSSWITHNYGNEVLFEEYILTEIQNLRSGMKRTSFNQSFLSFSTVFALATIAMISFIAISVIERLAQKKQKEIDEDILQRIVKSKVSPYEKIKKLSELSSKS